MSTPIFSIIPIEVALDDRLTKMQLRVLIALLSFRNKNTDTVWPKRETLAERCGYDVRTISRVTTQLVELGWLQKSGQGGFSKASEYRVTVPDLDTVVLGETVSELGTEDRASTVSGSETVAKPETVASSGTTTVSEPGTKRCPDRTPAKNRQRTEKGTDHISYRGFDFASWPVLPQQQTLDDWFAMRKRIKADVSQTVVTQFGRQMTLAHQAGYSVDDCLALCVTKAWRGFNFDWLKNVEAQHAQGNRGSFPGHLSRSDRSDQAMRDYLASHARDDRDCMAGAEGMGPRALGFRHH